MKIMHVVGARPNFMKAAPVWRALSRRDSVRQMLVHTGQHYDVSMSDVFFQELALPAPDVNLRVGSGTHAQQTGRIMIEFESVVLERRPELNRRGVTGLRKSWSDSWACRGGAEVL